MFFGFESASMKIWIGFILSMVILLCTDISTPLSQALVNKIAFDDLIWGKALMGAVLLCVLSLSIVWAKHRHSSLLSQIKKVLKWQTVLKNLEKSCCGLDGKTRVLKKLFREMYSDLDLVAHYPQEFRQIEIGA